MKGSRQTPAKCVRGEKLEYGPGQCGGAGVHTYYHIASFLEARRLCWCSALCTTTSTPGPTTTTTTTAIFEVVDVEFTVMGISFSDLSENEMAQVKQGIQEAIEQEAKVSKDLVEVSLFDGSIVVIARIKAEDSKEFCDMAYRGCAVSKIKQQFVRFEPDIKGSVQRSILAVKPKLAGKLNIGKFEVMEKEVTSMTATTTKASTTPTTTAKLTTTAAEIPKSKDDTTQVVSSAFVMSGTSTAVIIMKACAVMQIMW